MIDNQTMLTKYKELNKK
uniref:Uncharacterized protein n=1 Tax=Arundo donax TaxID=35708 RepID=A0A0A9CTJ4_ARUDO